MVAFETQKTRKRFVQYIRVIGSRLNTLDAVRLQTVTSLCNCVPVPRPPKAPSALQIVSYTLIKVLPIYSYRASPFTHELECKLENPKFILCTVTVVCSVCFYFSRLKQGLLVRASHCYVAPLSLNVVLRTITQRAQAHLQTAR